MSPERYTSSNNPFRNSIPTIGQNILINLFAPTFIVEDVFLYGHTAEQPIDYFITVMYLLKNHGVTLKLKK